MCNEIIKNTRKFYLDGPPKEEKVLMCTAADTEWDPELRGQHH
jgi:hypothetical protein